MTTLREAATMALEALEAIHEADTAGATPTMVVEARKMYEPTITALRAALTEDAMQKFTDVNQELEAALAEPVQEPDPGEYHGWVLREVLFEKGEPVGHREPVQEPYAWMAVGGTIWRHKTSEDDVPLYTAPRVPLAEWQINDLMANIDPEDVDSWSFRQGVYATEKHHGVRP